MFFAVTPMRIRNPGFQIFHLTPMQTPDGIILIEFCFLLGGWRFTGIDTLLQTL